MKNKRKGRQVISTLAFPIFLTIIVGLLVWGTLERNEIWNDELRLWLSSVNHSPYKGRPYNNVGSVLLRMRAFQMAQPFLDRAIFLLSGPKDLAYAETHNNYALLLVEQGKTQEAVEHLRLAIKVQPNSCEIHNNLGIFLVALKQYDEGIKHIQKAIKLNPDFPLARQNLIALLGDG